MGEGMDEYKLQYRTICYGGVSLCWQTSAWPRSVLSHWPAWPGFRPSSPPLPFHLPRMSTFLGGLLGSPLGCRAYLFKAFSRYSWIHFNFGSMHTCLLLLFSLALPKQKGRHCIAEWERGIAWAYPIHLTQGPSCCPRKPQVWKLPKDYGEDIALEVCSVHHSRVMNVLMMLPRGHREGTWGGGIWALVFEGLAGA